MPFFVILSFLGKSIEVSQNDKMFEKTKDVSEGLAQVPGAVRAELLRFTSSTLFEMPESSKTHRKKAEKDL